MVDLKNWLGETAVGSITKKGEAPEEFENYVQLLLFLLPNIINLLTTGRPKQD